MSDEKERPPDEFELQLLKKAETYPGYIEALQKIREKELREPSILEKLFIGREAHENYLIATGQATKKKILRFKREFYSQPSPKDIKR